MTLVSSIEQLSRTSTLFSGTPYVVSVQTGNVSSAGTDAKVFITLNGEKTKIAKYPLQKPEGGKNPFEKGNKDVFKFNDTDVGKVGSCQCLNADRCLHSIP